MFFVDSYSHPVPCLKYIKESIPGPGIDKDIFYSWFETTCTCSEDSDCTSDCECIRNFGQVYRNGLLTEENLKSERGIFECGPYCSCGILCHNRVVQRGPNDFLQIRDAGKKGFGVFAMRSFFPGTFIAEYAGELIGKEIARKRYNYLTGYDKYMLLLKEHYPATIVETYLDARFYGNIARYINHSCNPNCVIIPVRTGNLIPKVAIFSKRKIDVCEEITYTYQHSPIMSKSVCYCRSPKCKGFIPTGFLEFH